LDNRSWSEIAAAQAVAEGTGDEKTIARFFWKPILNRAETEKANRPIYAKRVFVEIITPGSGTPKTFLANDKHRKRFKQFYNWFQQQQNDVLDGTPIEKWNQIDSDKAATLKWYGFTTVERLAEFDPNENPGLTPEDVAIVGMARDYLAGRDEKDKEIEALKEQLAEAQKPKRGRPRKVDEEQGESHHDEDEIAA